MTVKINSNLASLTMQRYLARASGELAISFERLSSGQRINRASDDAAGLSIVSKLSADSRVYAQALRNANDGISALGIAQSALQQGSDIVMRLRELATSSASGSLARTQRISNDKEAYDLVSEYNRIFASTKFNGLTSFSHAPRGKRG